MPSFPAMLSTIYIFPSIFIFLYTCSSKLQKAENYFSAALLILDDPFTKLLLYNMIICMAILVYKFTVKVFYEEIRENQMMKIRQKIGYKVFEMLYFLYAARSSLDASVFLCLSVLFLMFIFHTIAIARANEIINTQTQTTSMMVRLLAHFLLMLFVDYELTSGTFLWLFSSDSSDSSYVLFAYYCVTFGLSIIESAICLFVHFYEVYTENVIENSDIMKVKIKFIINVPKLVIQLLLSVLIAYRIKMYFFMIITSIELIVELDRTKKSYSTMKKLIDKMKNLRELSHSDLQKQHDRTCTVCMQEAKNTALMLPCKHLFHKQCLRMWIIKNENHHCPKCKKSFDFENVSKDRIEREEKLKKTQEQFRANWERREKNDPLGFEIDEEAFKYSQLQKKEQKKAKLLEKAIREKEEIEKQENGYETEMPMIKQDSNQKSQQFDFEEKAPLAQKKVNDDEVSSEFESESGQRKYRNALKPVQIGSVPFGLPTQAIYRRQKGDLAKRKLTIQSNNKFLKLMKLDPAKQLLFVPQFQ